MAVMPIPSTHSRENMPYYTGRVKRFYLIFIIIKDTDIIQNPHHPHQSQNIALILPHCPKQHVDIQYLVGE